MCIGEKKNRPKVKLRSVFSMSDMVFCRKKDSNIPKLLRFEPKSPKGLKKKFVNSIIKYKVYAEDDLLEMEKVMKKLSIAVCDDIIEICSQMETLLTDVLKEKNHKFEIEMYQDGETLCKDLEKIKYDIIFLDIELPGMNGVDVGRYIRETLKDEHTQIAYISARDEYAIELFDYRPINFLVKPLTIEKVQKVINKYLVLFGEDDHYFAYKKGYDFFKVNMSSIMYFLCEGRKAIIVTENRRDEFYDSLNSIYSQVKNHKFLFIHKSIIINYNYIKKYLYEQVEMVDGTLFNVSQSRRKIVREQFSQIIKESRNGISK